MIPIETIRIKIRRFYIRKTAKLRRKKINNSDFTIISNNCWGGFIYQSYNLKYNSPLVGLFFMADDYIEFVSDIKKWIYKSIEFIDFEKSKYYDNFKKWDKFGKYPIGKFENSNIEIHFLHYSSEKEVLDNWERRLRRINWNKVLYKFNDQNLCTIDHLKKFSELPYENKICFTSKDYKLKDIIYIKTTKCFHGIPTSYEPFGQSNKVNINERINNL